MKEKEGAIKQIAVESGEDSRLLLSFPKGRAGGIETAISMQPPSLLSLTIDSAHRHIANFVDLSAVPDHILLELFLKTLQAGKLNEKVLKLFMATGNEEILSLVRSLNIRPILSPVLPTRCSEKF